MFTKLVLETIGFTVSGTAPRGPPEEFGGCIDLEVDSPSAYMGLGTVPLTASVGSAKLHTPKDMEVRCVQVWRKQSLSY